MLRFHTHKLLIPAEYFLFRKRCGHKLRTYVCKYEVEKKDSHIYIEKSRQTNAKRTRYLLRKKNPSINSAARRIIYIYYMSIYYVGYTERAGRRRLQDESDGGCSAGYRLYRRTKEMNNKNKKINKKGKRALSKNGSRASAIVIFRKKK